MKIIMLEEEIAKDIDGVLNWAIERLRHDGEKLQADRYSALKAFLQPNSRDLCTTAELARRGGMAKSERKAEAARFNGAKGGAPGNYYGCTLNGDGSRDRYLAFRDKESRDIWTSTGRLGERLALPATDTGLRREQRTYPERILDGSAILDSQVDADAFESYRDID
jgi:hypothetical protein